MPKEPKELSAEEVQAYLDSNSTRRAYGLPERLYPVGETINGGTSLRNAIADAVEQSERSSEAKVPNPHPPDALTEPQLWLYGGVGGAAFSTVLGIGLVGIFYEKEPVAGTILSIIGVLGLVAMIALLKGHRIGVLHAAIASLIATWCFLGYVLWAVPRPAAALATGRTWAPLNSDAQKLASIAVKLVPTRERFRVICLTTDCKDLAQNFMDIFHEAGWNPVFASNTSYYQEPFGLVLYLKDPTDKSLREAIEKSTNLKIDHVEISTDPFMESLFIGLRP